MWASDQNPGRRFNQYNSRSSCQEKRGRRDSNRKQTTEPEWSSINSSVATHRARRPLGLDRPMFEKLMTNPLADLGGYPCAVRFVNALVCMSEIEPLDVIWRLVSPSQYGLQRIRQILMISQVNLFTNDNIEIINTLTMPILRAIVNTPARYDPSARTSLHTLLSAIWAVPFIMQRLLEVLSVQMLEDTESLVLFLLCSVYLDVVKTDHAENWSHLHKLVESLLHQGISRAERISTLIQRKPNEVEGNTLSLCAIENQPGSRHGNDFFDFKRIQITPIPDETDLTKTSDNAFLPMANGEDGFLINDPVARMMDRAFRLLREDMVSMLRDNLSKPTPIVFASAAVDDFELRPQPCAIISFDAPVAVQKMPAAHKKEFWRKSRWLSMGSLVCIAKDRNPIVFGEVIHRQLASDRNYDFYDPAIKDEIFPVDDDGRDDGCEKRYVVGIAVESEASFRLLANLQSTNDDLELIQCCFNFFSYKPVLEALQCSSDFPFYHHLVIPSKVDSSSPSVEGDTAFKVLKDLDEASYQKSLLLDHAQRRAFASGVDVNQKLSLIQGPPGTGKTLIGVLIALALAAKPFTRILCVCYTNHQLDQFLEALLDAGLTDIVRIGGRCSNDRLAKYVLSHKQGRLRPQSLEGHYRWRLHDIYQLMKELENDIEELTAIISRPLIDWPFFDAHLDPEMSSQFDLDDCNNDSIELGYDGQIIRTPADLWRNWRLGYMINHISRSKHFLWSLNHQERLALLRTWQEEIRIEQINVLAAKFVQYKQLREERISINQKNELPILMKAKVIGCTATGAAKYRALLNDVKCDVMIVEEAAELLEANVLGAINVYTEKVVMIGDHMQLRPKINNHRLSVESENGLDLNRSTFERLIIGGHPFVALQTQHRMRPEISDVVRRLTYHDLIDGDTVKNYPHLKGLKGDLIFVNHLGLERMEKTLSTSSRLVKSTSKINILEAKLVVGTALYLCQQGYRTDQIVILTPYLGQLLEIREVLNRIKIEVILGESDQSALDEFSYETSVAFRSKRSSDQHGSIRVSTVDNFQGQQADVVLVSLVRNNPNGRIGFLKQPERLNVLLTRSRHGLILFGNRSCLAEASPLWDKTIQSLRVTNGIPVICPRHDVEILVRDHLDFVTLTPHGGCTNICEANLSCGHRCQSPCHDPDIIPHARCSVRFPDKCPYGHKIMRPCRQDRLAKCRQQVVDNCPDCNMQIVRKCYVPIYEARCFNCDIEEERKRSLLEIETDKVNKFTALMEDQAKKLLDIEIDNARLASEMVIKKTEQNADALLHKALSDKKQAEMEAIQTCHKIASDVACEVRKCHEDAERRRLNEQARIDSLVREAQRTSATLKAAHEAIIQHSQDVALEEVANLEADRDKEASRIQETLRLAEDLRSMSMDVSCGICFEDYKRSDCVVCPSIDTRPNQLHYFCRECFGQLVQHESDGDLRVLSLHSGMIVCPYERASECVSPPFSDATIAKWVSHAVFKQYMKSKEKVLEKAINDEFEHNFPARLELEIKRRTEEAPVLIRRKIIEFLTPACPRCHAAFIDFDGCAALTCHNCPCRFCAFCLHDCGDDSHVHVANCKFNPTANVYVSVEIWQDAHRHWIHDQIVAVLHTLSYSQIPQSLKDCEKELIDLGIDPQTLVAALKVHKYSQ